jgi:glucosyl-dolichyl phosphate glucuronosyltransferase
MSGERRESIIVCTCNRAVKLKDTLEALAKLPLPSEWAAEVLVVDNGCTDNTASIVKNSALRNMQARYLFESRKGQC